VAPGMGEDIGPAHAPVGVASSTGVPHAITDLVSVVPFNDVEAVERVLRAHPGEVAGMIVEPIMMNAGIIPPEDGYLADLRDVLHRHGALVTFDEVKTGFTVGPGGVTRRLGVVPDLVCLAKSMGGGLPTSAIGGTDAVMALIADGRYQQVGTFNGNPLAMAAVRATLTEVLTPDAYRHLDRLAGRLESGLHAAIAASGLPWRVVAAGAKGCVSFRAEAIRDYRDFALLDSRYGHAHWLAQHNGGVFLPPWGKVEQWLISVQHEDEDIDRFVTNFERFLRRLTVPAEGPAGP
jgi:glutamate-1-semialdehyde 2,1-aminomutase